MSESRTQSAGRFNALRLLAAGAPPIGAFAAPSPAVAQTFTGPLFSLADERRRRSRSAFLATRRGCSRP